MNHLKIVCVAVGVIALFWFKGAFVSAPRISRPAAGVLLVGDADGVGSPGTELEFAL